MQKYLYEDLYKLEDKHWWHISKRRNALMLLNNSLSIKKPRILDIGCGTGKNIEELNKIGKTIGIDNSKEAIFYCHKRGIKNVSIANADATGFKINSFDVVTVFDLLEHTDDKKALKEISRILKPNGLLVITVPAFDFLWSRWDIILHHKRRYRKKSLTKLLKNNNFKVLKISYVYSFLFLPALIIRKVKSKFLKNNYSSDFKINQSIINSFLLNLSKFESKFINLGIIPFGTSIICIAKNEK